MAALAGALVLAGCNAQSSSPDHGPAHPHGDATHSSAVPGELPSAYPDRVVLTWSEDPARSLSVTWRTDTTVTDAVAQVALARAEPSFYTDAETIEAATETLDLSQVDGQMLVAHYHSTTFRDLTPDTLYAYRVGDGERWSEWFHARTVSDGPAPLSFLYFGDAQNNIRSHGSRAIRAAYQQAPRAHFAIHAGDLVNNAHRNVEWGAWHQAGGFIHSMLPSVPVPGNHEYDPFEVRTAPGTFRVEAVRTDTSLEGTVYEPDGDDEPFVATLSSGRGPWEGTWRYVIDNNDYSGPLTLRQGPEGWTGTVSNPTGRDVSRPDETFAVEDVQISGDSLSARFQLVVEQEGEEQLSAHWRPGFTLPTNGPDGFEETAYFLDIQGVRVIGLNTEPALSDEAALDTQTAWLDAVLTDNPQQWTVVTFHHPMFSSGEGRDNRELRDRWRPLFDEHRVDLVLQGHDHTYARGRTLNLAQGVNARSPVGGTVYVNSVSGAKMYAIRPDRWANYEAVDMDRAAANTQLFQVIRVDGDRIQFRAYTVTGELYDAFELTKQSDAPNAFTALVPSTPERTHETTIEYERPRE
jgi:hypothetical protein